MTPQEIRAFLIREMESSKDCRNNILSSKYHDADWVESSVGYFDKWIESVSFVLPLVDKEIGY